MIDDHETQNNRNVVSSTIHIPLVVQWSSLMSGSGGSTALLNAMNMCYHHNVYIVYHITK